MINNSATIVLLIVLLNAFELLDGLFEQFQVVSSYTVVGTFGPTEGLNGFTESFQVRHIFGFKMLGQLILDVDNSPEILSRMFYSWLEKAWQDTLRR